MNYLEAQKTPMARGKGLSASQIATLAYLDAKIGFTGSLKLDRSRAASAAALERRGLAARCNYRSGRQWTITEAGRTVLAVLREQVPA